MYIIGAVGRNGSGKDELVEYLNRRYNIPIVSIGDIAREIASDEGIKPTRENLHKISEKYFAQFGKDFFIKKAIEKIDRMDSEIIGITSIRTPVDVKVLKDHYGSNFLLIYVKVEDPQIRFKRAKRRGEARDPDSFEEFLKQEKEEEELFNISDTISEADITVDNSSRIEDFYQEIETKIVEMRLSGMLSREKRAREESKNRRKEN